MSLHYIQSTFLTFELLTELSGVSPERLHAFMDAGCLPGPAYRVSGPCQISSFFGDHEERIELQYFPRAYVAKATMLERSGLSLQDLAKSEKASFFKLYAETLEALGAQTFGLGSLFGPSGMVDGAEANALLENEWQAYLDGTYGLCTRTASATEIATKEAMIAKIKYLTAVIDAGSQGQLVADLKQAVDLLDQVSAPFAPHEVARSSRERYVNQVRTMYLGEAA